MNFIKRAWAEIDISALRKNITALKAVAGEKEVIAVVKANAYGHGAGIVCPSLWEEGIRYFAVSNMYEALELREILPNAEIIIFGYVDTEHIEDNDFIYTAGSVEYVDKLSKYAQSRGTKLRVHIKLDTGMARVGVDGEKELESILRFSGLEFEAVYTHFASAESYLPVDMEYTKRQQKMLTQTTNSAINAASVKSELSSLLNRKMKIHSQNSGGMLCHREFEGDFVRAGISMYGYHPNPAIKDAPVLYPVMTLKSLVWQVKDIPKDTYISYGRTFKSERTMRVAVIPIGYADGYSRALSNKGAVSIKCKCAPVLGRVCMDQIIVDISEIDGVRTGDEVIVYSNLYEYTDVENISESLGTISYEVLCNVSARVQRMQVDNGVDSC
ncbi:MAG: alanine racemase [Eubacterium sp.]|jgi:alanine racemase|nr:alanine racemase [Eubacterium sp.]